MHDITLGPRDNSSNTTFIFNGNSSFLDMSDIFIG
jgi:hypothetical protein